MARGLPGAPAVVHVRVCPAEDASPETILPELSAPYLCVPYDITVRLCFTARCRIAGD
jgi:hypothetical protein